MSSWFINNAQWIIILGGAITILGTFLAAKKSDADQQESKDMISANIKLSEQITELTLRNQGLSEANIKLSQQNLEYSEKQAGLMSDNLGLSAKLVEAGKKEFEYYTGANSFCELILMHDQSEIGQVAWKIHGANPLEGVSARIADLNQPIEPTFESIFNTTVSVPSLFHGEVQIGQQKISMDKTKGVRLNIFYSHRGRAFTQSLVMDWDGKRWTRETIITAGTDTLFENNWRQK